MTDAASQSALSGITHPPASLSSAAVLAGGPFPAAGFLPDFPWASASGPFPTSAELRSRT